MKKFTKIFESSQEEVDIKNIFADLIDNHGFQLSFDEVKALQSDIDIESPLTHQLRNIDEMGIHKQYYKRTCLDLRKGDVRGNPHMAKTTDSTFLRDLAQALERLQHQFDRVEYSIKGTTISLNILELVTNDKYESNIEGIKEFIKKCKPSTEYEVEFSTRDEANHQLLFFSKRNGGKMNLQAVKKYLKLDGDMYKHYSRVVIDVNDVPFVLGTRQNGDVIISAKWKDDYIKIFLMALEHRIEQRPNKIY